MTITVSDRGVEPAQRPAARFFWCWLLAATAMSVCGNVTHALLIAPDRYRWVAAVAALVPPIVLIAGNHSLALLVRTRPDSGAVYWVALVATVLLALGAFVLSFDALRSLVVAVGIRMSIAWIWPVVIDVAIAQATLCLLSLTRTPRARTGASGGVPRGDPGSASPAAGGGCRCEGPALGGDGDSGGPVGGAGDRVGDAQLRRPVDGRPADDVVSVSPGLEGARPRRPVGEGTLAAVAQAPGARVGRSVSVDAAAVQRHLPIAESLIRDGVTTKEARLVATILAERETGARPGTIERQHKVHHSVVRKVWAAADKRTG
jgi:hypothetical protein